MGRSKIPNTIAIVTAVAVSAAAVGATRATPPVLVPGSSDVTTKHLVAGNARYRYLTRAPGDTAEREMSTGLDERIVTTYKGKPALLLVKSSARGGQTSFLDSALVMHASLAPVWETSRLGSRVTRFEYDGKQVRLTVTTPDSGTRNREHTYDVPVFHFNELDVLVSSLPLREGYEAILPLYSEGSDELEMDSVRVMARDSAGVWSVRFADPAIVSTYGIHGTTREIVRYDVVSRRNNGQFRRVRVQ